MFYCSTLSQLFPVFTPYSCQWRDCALGELLISLGKIIMPIILCYDVYYMYFIFIILSCQNTQYNSSKNVEQWRNSVIPPLSCCEPLQCWWFQIGRDFNYQFMIWISSIFFFIHSQKFSSWNSQELSVKMTFNEQTMTISTPFWYMPWQCLLFRMEECIYDKCMMDGM